MGKAKKFSKIHEFMYELKAGDGMTEEVVFVGPDVNMSEAGRILRSKHISAVPVIDRDKIVGLLCMKDYIQWLENSEEDCPVAEKMTGKVKTVFDFLPLVEVLKKFEKYRYRLFPVINDDLELVGIINEGDIIKCIFKKLEEAYLEEEIQTARATHIFEDIVADKASMKFQYRIIGNDFKRAGECASGLKKTLKRFGLHSHIIRRVAIATYEAEMNMIVFAIEGEITAELEQNKLIISAIDTGPGIEDIEKAMRPGYSTAPEWVKDLGFGAGMGLYNIKKCSDTMNIHSIPGEGTHLEINFILD